MDEVQKIADVAKAIFLRDGYHAPIVIAKGSKGGRAVLLEQFGDTSDERAKDMFSAGAMLAKKAHIGELELIVFVCEGWMGTNIAIRPSLDLNRREVLLISSLDARTQEEHIIQFEIKRDPKGQVLDLKELVFPETVTSKGRLLPAFQKGYQAVSPVHN